MTVHGFGACILTALMRADRSRDADTSWLLFGPTHEPAELAALEQSQDAEMTRWKFAAE